MSNFDEYGDLAGTGFENKEPVSPEEDSFHSIYISGEMRQNHVGITEKVGQLQVRGVQYNLDKVYMIMTHTKQVLCNASVDSKKKETIHCFSFQEGEGPWYGTSGRECGKNSTKRAANPQCANCRAQLIVAGVVCDESGKMLTDEDGKPKFGFIRGKGMKYSGVSEYLTEIAKLDLSPIFEPVTEQSTQFEKTVVNNKRFVTEITITTADSAYGRKMVFALNKGTELSKTEVLNILKIAKANIGEFNKKFDWSKTKGNPVTSKSVVDESMRIPDTKSSSQEKQTTKNTKSGTTSEVVDEDIDLSGINF